MNVAPELLLIGGVVAVGVLHTVVPDHWLPIALLARQQGWSRTETGWAAARAGFGHVLSTLMIGIAVWLGGAALAERCGATIDIVSGAALVAFGGWIAVAALRELRGESGHTHHHHDRHEHHHHHHREPAPGFGPEYAAAGAASMARHIHVHRHGDGVPHLHWHEHVGATVHAISQALELDPPLHEHAHQGRSSTALLLILGSSPMVEGIPAFFAAGRYGPGLIAGMAVAFALSTVATYVALCVAFTTSLQRLRLGPVERYGEVLSGALIAAIGLAFGILSIA
jgi:nickel/cobalt transporter (NicO) family protein